MKNIRKTILIYIFFFILLIIRFYLFKINTDEIWSYGFSYNISKGLLPYKDFNMVIGPLYSIITSIPMYLFGNRYILFNIFNCILYALIFTFIYKKLGNKSFYLLLLFMICPTLNNYNNLCALLVILILFLENGNIKNKNIIIGIIIGCIFMIKHNVGILLILAYLYNNRKTLFKSIINVLIPIILTTIYLLINNIFFNYIDYCFLGANNFISNLYIEGFTTIVYIIFIIPLIKYLKENKNKEILYILAFQIIIFPLFDLFHVIIALLPVVYYYLVKDNYKYKLYIRTIIILLSILLIPIEFNNSFNIVTSNNYLKYCNIDKSIIEYIDEYNKYLNELDSKYYLFIDNAYLIKLSQNKNPNYFDLINKGNLGSNEQKYIDILKEECSKETCYFILGNNYFNKKKTSQLNMIFKDYVIENSEYLKTLPSGDRIYIKKHEDN